MSFHKKINVGLNGLGRIGRSLLKQMVYDDFFEVTCVNELNSNIENIIYTLNYDSTYGVSAEKFTNKRSKIIHPFNNNEINAFNEKNIDKVPWQKQKIDVLIDASGLKVNSELINKKEFNSFLTVQTNSDNNKIKHLVHGVNENKFNSMKDNYISSSICDSVAISPLIKVLKKYLIKAGAITTVHPLLNYQTPLDSKSASWSVPGKTYGHFELGRSFINNIIPKPTSALNAISKVIDNSLNKKISCFSYRTPTTIVGSADMTFLLGKRIGKKELLSEIKLLNKNYEKDIISVSEEKLTSLDYTQNKNNSVLDLRWLEAKKIEKGTFLKIVLWYDNEWGYSSKVLDLIKAIKKI